ncbi:MAG: tyrosine-type recombinase/integrase [Legionella sp.]|uniref:tyrosine-type recombinase/integrase n=1 Tax=Legionella sp. TaxID=459 RepID=UPI0039E5F86C
MLASDKKHHKKSGDSTKKHSVNHLFIGKIENIDPPKRIKNSLYRAREYLTPTEIDRLIAAAKRTGRHGQRDATMILLAYRHGLRVSELISLCWSQLDLDQGLFYVIRRKNGLSTHHPLFGAELRALRQLKRDYPETDYVFMTERKAPITGNTVRKIISRAGEVAQLGFSVHPHMLRHSTGFKLANDGQDTRSIQHYLGHKNIQNTVRYTEMAATRFKGFLND